MENYTKKELLFSIRKWTLIFIVLLLLSGITAFPIESELKWLTEHDQLFPTFLRSWFFSIYQAVATTNQQNPSLAYGTDWLAFAHIVIATAFIGPLRDPVRNRWVFQFGMLACTMVFPLAFICGPIRHIPFYWQLIDCSFGILGFIPLYICYRKSLKIEQVLTLTTYSK